VVQAAKGSQPQVAFAAGRGVDAVLAAAIVAAIAAVVGASPAMPGQSVGQHEWPLGEVRRAVDAFEQPAFEKGHAIEALGIHTVGDHARVLGQALAG
jgi:hypothetical protein